GEVLRPVNATAQVITTALVGVAAASIIVRLRHAGGVQRQQLKWLAYAAFLRPAHQPHAGLRAAHRPARARLRRQRAGVGAARRP
ncbi:MAG TPA: hypothetical protein VG411_08555, partial [Actinomycetota bacterium]|nr:hypothetical protein [Actinomycetota bacterium]